MWTPSPSVNSPATWICMNMSAGNAEKAVRNAKLPWKQTVALDVGAGGGAANLIARNPGNDTTVTCRITMAGKPLNEAAATDGYVDPSCSVLLAAQRLN